MPGQQRLVAAEPHLHSFCPVMHAVRVPQLRQQACVAAVQAKFMAHQVQAVQA